MKNNEYLYTDDIELADLLGELRLFMERCVKTLYKPDEFRKAVQGLTSCLDELADMLTQMNELYTRSGLPLMREAPGIPSGWQKMQDDILAVCHKLNKQPHPKRGKRPADALIARLEEVAESMDFLDGILSQEKAPAVYIDYGKREFEDYQTNYWRRIERKQLVEIERLTVGKEEFFHEQWKEACKRLKEDTESVLNDEGFVAYYEALGRELWYYRHCGKADACLRVLENLLLVTYYRQRMKAYLSWQDTLPVRKTLVREVAFEPDHKAVRDMLETFAESHPSPRQACSKTYFGLLVDELVADGLGGTVKAKIQTRNRRKFVYQLLCLLQEKEAIGAFSDEDLEPFFPAIGQNRSNPVKDTFARYGREVKKSGNELRIWVLDYLKTHPFN